MVTGTSHVATQELLNGKIAGLPLCSEMRNRLKEFPMRLALIVLLLPLALAGCLSFSSSSPSPPASNTTVVSPSR
jgi:hypothetical protein